MSTGEAGVDLYDVPSSAFDGTPDTEQGGVVVFKNQRKGVVKLQLS